MIWLLRPDALRAFEDEEIASSLPRYIGVAERRIPPLFRLAQRIFVNARGDLWKAHEEGLKKLSKCIAGNCMGNEGEGDISLLELKVKLARMLARKCELCEWKCGVNRLEGKVGVCRVVEPRIASAFIHMGEEPPVTPSGTIFFSGCNFKCVFCQNWDISQNPLSGISVNEEYLASTMDNLRRDGARNINLVGGEPTPNIPTILGALELVEEDFPIIWNSNMYMSEKAMKLLLGIVDLWLPDFKYWSYDCARKYSGIPRYRDIVTRNLAMARSFPPGEMIIRHLVLPGHIECCTKPILKWISLKMPDVLVNIMDQYRPEYMAGKYPEINRRVSSEEIREAYKLAESLGLRWRSIS